jgi:hypothetical protein
MPRTLRLILFISGGIILLLVLVLLGLYRAYRYEPEFYRKTLAVEPAVSEKASEQLIRRALDFENRVKREGPWSATFTAEQINGWLAYDLPKNHPQLLPPELHEPCIVIEPNRIQFACRYEKGVKSSVLCLTVELYLPEPNVLAVRVVGATAGKIPLPLKDLENQISEAAQNTRCRVDWKQIDGTPVALMTFPRVGERGDLVMKIKNVKIDDGLIQISGTTERVK